MITQISAELLKLRTTRTTKGVFLGGDPRRRPARCRHRGDRRRRERRPGQCRQPRQRGRSLQSPRLRDAHRGHPRHGRRVPAPHRHLHVPRHPQTGPGAGRQARRRRCRRAGRGAGDHGRRPGRGPAPMWIDGAPIDLINRSVLEAFGGNLLAATLFGVLGVSLGAVIRNQLAAVTIAIGWAFLIEGSRLAVPRPRHRPLDARVRRPSRHQPRHRTPPPLGRRRAARRIRHRRRPHRHPIHPHPRHHLTISFQVERRWSGCGPREHLRGAGAIPDGGSTQCGGTPAVLGMTRRHTSLACTGPVARFEHDHRRLGRPPGGMAVELRFDRDPALPQSITLLPGDRARARTGRCLLARQANDGIRVCLEIEPPRGMVLVPAVHGEHDEIAGRPRRSR